MKNKFLAYLVLLLTITSPVSVFAADWGWDSQWLFSMIWGYLSSFLFWALLFFAQIVTTWMLWIGFFTSSIIDTFLINVPDLSALINIVSPQAQAETGAFFQNSFFAATWLMLVISVGLWLIMWGFQYFKVAIANINQSAKDDDERKMSFIKFTFKMIIALVSMAFIPYLLKALFYLIFLISVLLFKMGIAPLNISEASPGWINDRDLLFRYPMTSIFMTVTDVDGATRKEILTNLYTSKDLKQSFNASISKYVDSVSKNIKSILSSADWLRTITIGWEDWSAIGWIITSLTKAAFYIMMVFMFLTVNFKIFTMLISRFVSIVIHSVFIPLNMAMLWTPLLEKIWLRSIVSYLGSLMITPIMFAILWFGLTLILTFKSNIILAVGDWAQTDLYLYGAIMIMLWYGVFTFMYQVANNFGTELENLILGYSGRSGYDSSADVQQGMGAAKTYLGLAAAQQAAQQAPGQLASFAGAKTAQSAGAIAWSGMYAVWKWLESIGLSNYWEKLSKMWWNLAVSQANKLFWTNRMSNLDSQNATDPGDKWGKIE